VLYYFAREAAGAVGTRHSPRPMLGERLTHHSGASRRESADSHLRRHCEEPTTKQSILVVALDCFAEPVIGRAFARPVGSQ
jgi:hypothetical protein